MTADRPAALRRCLSSALTHCRDHGNTPRLIVVDGSKDRSCGVLNRSTIESLRADSRCPLVYVGREGEQELQSRLVPVGLSAKSVKTMFCPGGQGAGRNLLMLMTVGDNVMFLDDDVICAPWAPRAHHAGLSVDGHRDPRRVVSFPSRDQAVSATVPVAVDLLAAHCRLLNHELTSLLDHFAGDVLSSEMCPHVSSALERHRSQRVKTTFTGVAGDAGLYCPYRVLMKAHPPRELMRDREAFACALRSREVVRVVRRDTVTHQPFLMGYNMAVANHDLLPPFVPIGRNEDGLFAEMLALVDPDALFGHISYGVVHDSHRTSEYSAEPVSASQTRLSDLLLWLIRRHPPDARDGSPASALRQVAGYFAALARLNAAEFILLCAETVGRVRASELVAAEAACDRADASPQWREALRRYRNAVAHAMQSPRFVLPVELHDRCEGDVSGGFHAVQDLLGAFAEVVEAQPALRAAKVL